MSKPLHKTTLHTWGHWAAYILLTILGFCTADYFWSVHDTFNTLLPHFPGPSAPEAVGLVTVQLYGMVFLLILLVLSRRFSPKQPPILRSSL